MLVEVASIAADAAVVVVVAVAVAVIAAVTVTVTVEDVLCRIPDERRARTEEG
jgi:hypothetical protein